MQQELRIIQGTTAQYGGSTLGFVGLDGEGRISLDVWDANEKAWLTRLRLREGEVFSAGGHYLRVAQLEEGAQRPRLQLMELGDAGGLQAAQAEHAVLPQHGCLEVGLTRLEFTAPPTAAAAQIRMWPKLYPLKDTDPAQIQQTELTVGQLLTFGHKQLKVERIQAAAGDIPGFVAFSMQP